MIEEIYNKSLDNEITKEDAIESKVLLIKKGKKNYYLGLID